jgi:hypothetical protein
MPGRVQLSSGLFLGGGGLIIIFMLWQSYKGDNAMIPPRLMTQRTISMACFINFFAMGAVLTSIYYLPEWFQVIKAVSPTKSGIMYLPLSISDILSAILAGVAVSHMGYANPFILVRVIGERDLPILDSFLSKFDKICILCIVSLRMNHCLNSNFHPKEAMLTPQSSRSGRR